MVITEKEIFKYVLFPDDLSQDIKDYIQSNESLYSDLIGFYKSYINSYNDNDISNLAKKALRKIPALQNIIALYPVSNKKIFNTNALILAAASQEIAAKQSESVTYSDENSDYLVRLINNKDNSILYFFSKKENKNQELKITLFPSDNIFHIKNASCKIEIHHVKEIEKILIEEETIIKS